MIQYFDHPHHRLLLGNMNNSEMECPACGKKFEASFVHAHLSFNALAMVNHFSVMVVICNPRASSTAAKIANSNLIMNAL